MPDASSSICEIDELTTTVRRGDLMLLGAGSLLELIVVPPTDCDLPDLGDRAGDHRPTARLGTILTRRRVARGAETELVPALLPR
jgi:hypothetical protein